MFLEISNNSVVHCSFRTTNNTNPENKTGFNSAKAEIFYANTSNLMSQYSILEKYVDNQDRLKADKIKYDEDRYTFLFCHTILRIILSKRLNIPHEDLQVTYDNNNKPYISGNPLYFNISHTRDSFALVISENFRVGIDLEMIDRNIDFNSILRTSFSSLEQKFILELPDDSRNRFFLLWTRKEALLKAIGSGIALNLTNIEVLNTDNLINRTSFHSIVDDSVLCDYYIYSERIIDGWISVAIPQKAEIVINQIDNENPDCSNYLLSFLKS